MNEELVKSLKDLAAEMRQLVTMVEEANVVLSDLQDVLDRGNTLLDEIGERIGEII